MQLRALAPSSAPPLVAGRWAHPLRHVGACRHRAVPLRPLLPRLQRPTPAQHRPQRQCLQPPKASAPEAAAPATPVPPPSSAAAQKAALRLAVETLRPDWLLLTGTMAALVATIFFTLLFPLLIGEVFDVVRAHGGLAGEAAGAAVINPFAATGAAAAAAATPTSFTAVMLKLGACLVLSATGNALVAWCSALLGERFGYRLRGRLMETLLRRDQAFFDASTTGDLVSRLTLDVTVLQTTLADFIGQRGFRSMFEVVGALAMIALQQPLLALVSCAITPLLSRLLRAVVVRSSAIIYKRQTVAAEALEFAGERLSQVQTVQVFAQQEREAGAFAQLSGSGYQLAQRYAFFQGVVEGAGRLAVNVGTVALLGFGGWLVIQGRISVGALLAVNVFNLFISVGLSSVAASLGEVGKALGALERISELVVPSSDPARQDAATAAAASSNSSSNSSSSSNGAAGTSRSSLSAGAAAGSSGNGSSHTNGIGSHVNGSSSHAVAAGSSNGSSSSSRGGASRVELRDVWFKYPGANNWAVQGINLTIEPGQTVALVGPSGGGKSTIAALLLGLYAPQRGAILVDGRPLVPKTDGGSGAAEAGMAAVLQQPMLMSGSVRQQIRYGKPEASQEEVLAAARAAYADEFVSQLPDAYDTEVGERGHALSGGQKQRLAIARALLMQPKVLVLDEVTSALDVASERYISSTLRSMAATKLIIAHRLSTVRQADVIVAVVGGRVVEQGTHHQLLALEGGTYRRLVKTAELGAFWTHSPAADTSDSKLSAREVAESMPV